jgi:hypothetical protein
MTLRVENQITPENLLPVSLSPPQIEVDSPAIENYTLGEKLGTLLLEPYMGFEHYTESIFYNSNQFIP